MPEQKPSRFARALAWIKKRVQCKCMLDVDADGKPDVEAGWDGENTSYGVVQ